jgi:uncharacterized protein with ParB-like and HNH nuclease domain
MEETEVLDVLGDEDVVIPEKYSITSYGADYTIDSLVKRIESGAIYIPSFQRQFVWKQPDSSRFIESLLLGLPVPGIFLARDDESQKLAVIDGQQRLRSLQYFYQGVFADTGKEFSLKNVQSEFEGLTYRNLNESDRRRLDDSILHATVIKQDDPKDGETSIYHIFERINTEGMQLKPQEIRASIYHGEFSDLLFQLNKNNHWRQLFGKLDKSMKDQELILRFLALNYYHDSYRQPMKEFLNRYMSNNRKLKLQSKEEITETFNSVMEIIFNSLGVKAFKPKSSFNAAIFDSISVGISHALRKSKKPDEAKLKHAYDSLISDPKFVNATERATANSELVAYRLDAAIKAFRVNE